MYFDNNEIIQYTTKWMKIHLNNTNDENDVIFITDLYNHFLECINIDINISLDEFIKIVINNKNNFVYCSGFSKNLLLNGVRLQKCMFCDKNFSIKNYNKNFACNIL